MQYAIYPKWDFWFENKPSGNPFLTSTLNPPSQDNTLINYTAEINFMKLDIGQKVFGQIYPLKFGRFFIQK
jgi:hypothetical protein